MVTKMDNAKLVWALYGVLAVGVFVSAVSVKTARAGDFDSCTEAECTAADNAAWSACLARGGQLYSFACPADPTPGNDWYYTYSCVINGTVTGGYGGFCD
jgi:hypothetical protein